LHALIDSRQQHLMFRLDTVEVFATFVDRLAEDLHERVAQGIDFGPQLGNFLFTMAGHAARAYLNNSASARDGPSLPSHKEQPQRRDQRAIRKFVGQMAQAVRGRPRYQA
jgi:hypothetical protein